jgi:hypothetical protein
VVRADYFLMTVLTLILAACGKFASDPSASRPSAAANPLQAEREDLIKLAVQKEVPGEVATLFTKERRQSDAALVNPHLVAGPKDPRLLASKSSLDRLGDVLRQRRTELLRLLEMMTKGRTLSKDERVWLVSLSNEFKAKAGNVEDLKQRVDSWPASFVLGSLLVLKNSWPSETELSERLTLLNTSNKAEFAEVRKLRARQASDSSKSEREKSQALVEELTKSLAPTAKNEMLKTVLDISTALQGGVVGEEL